MDKTFDVAVIGGGIAGLTAGLTAARLGRSTVILTGHTLGGHLISIEKIEGYPGAPDGVAGYELCPMTQGQAADAGAELAMSEVTGVAETDGGWQLATGNGDCTARTVIVATGTTLRTLGVPGETEFRGKGVSHCASCDAPLLGGKQIVVAGGGDSAMQEALTLAEQASKVTIAHHGDGLEGQASYIERVGAHPRIETRPRCEVAEILGDDAVTGARIRSTDDGATDDLEAAAVFVYIGLAPNTAFVDGLVRTDASGRIVTDVRLRTGATGLLAAGTVRAEGQGRAAAAAGDGAIAALSADRYLAGGAW